MIRLVEIVRWVSENKVYRVVGILLEYFHCVTLVNDVEHFITHFVGDVAVFYIRFQEAGQSVLGSRLCHNSIATKPFFGTNEALDRAGGSLDACLLKQVGFFPARPKVQHPQDGLENRFRDPGVVICLR